MDKIIVDKIIECNKDKILNEFNIAVQQGYNLGYVNAMKDLKEEKRTIEVRGFRDYVFHNMDCMISFDGEELGFFKSLNDIRPSQATYVKKEVAERLYTLFRK